METISIKQLLDGHRDKFEKEKCLLFLGPAFGLDASGKKIHEYVRQRLTDYYNQKEQDFKVEERLEAQFDNLFILRNLKSGRMHELFELRARLSEFYQEIEPHAVYEQIARLPIKAIISCSPDLLLRNAFQTLQIDHDFFYYSPKEQSNPPEVRSNVPVLYNLFGSAEDKDSFIVTYENFFNFVFAMLGDSDKIPESLKKALQEAELFMLLGFDLEKWYMPLILRRLNQEKEYPKQEKYSVVSRDANCTEDDEEKLATFFFVLEERLGSDQVIDTLTKKLQDKLRSGVQLNGTRKAAPVQKLVAEDKLTDALLLLQQLYEEHQLDIANVVATLGRWKALEQARQASIITTEKFDADKNLLRQSILDLARDLDRHA